MGHTEIAQSPCHCRYDREETVRLFLTSLVVVHIEGGEISWQRFGVVHDTLHAACLVEGEDYDDDKCEGHDDALHEVGGGHGHEAAHDGVGYYDEGTHYHGLMVTYAEQAVEKYADGLETCRGIRDEEYQYDNGGNGHQDISLVVITL